MQAIVLVGGEGTRLRPLTYSVPKQMLPIAEVPMLERVLSQLRAHGVDDAVLSLGYLPDAFVKAYPDGVAADVRLSYAVEPSPLDTAGAIRFAARSAGIDETFVVVNGDVLTDLDLGALVGFHRDRGAQGTVSLHPVEDPSAFGVVPTDDRGMVTAFVEKPPRDEAPTNLVNAGTYVLEPAVLDRIPDGRRVSIERETFPAMVADGVLYALPDDAYWLDAGTPEAYLRAHRDILAGKRGAPPAPGARAIGDGVWVLGSPSLEGEVRGPAIVGEGAVIARTARVEGSVVGRGSVVEPGAAVKGSVLMAGCRVGASSTVERSIVGQGASVGAHCAVRGHSVLGFCTHVEDGAVVDGDRVPA